MESSFCRVGLTGGVGSGKSEVAALFKEEGVPVLNLDTIGRELTNSDTGIVLRIGEICGLEVVTDGKLDRARVREILFSDREKRRRVEAFLHPIIWQRFQEECDVLRERGKKMVICEAALLVESGLHRELDRLILVTAPEDMRRERVMTRDKVTANLAEKMIRAQIADDDRPKMPKTILVENDGPKDILKRKVQDIVIGWKSEGLI